MHDRQLDRCPERIEGGMAMAQETGKKNVQSAPAYSGMNQIQPTIRSNKIERIIGKAHRRIIRTITAASFGD
jgi:hypothetical protein